MMPQLTSRSAAFFLLCDILDRKQTMDGAMRRLKSFEQLSDRDRHFAYLLVLTTLRRLGQTDALLDTFLSKPLPAKLHSLYHILRLGLVQACFLDVPAHAAVNETVALAQQQGFTHHRKLVNAILRRAQREAEALVRGQDAVRLNTPDWLWQRWCEHYGEKVTRNFCEAQLQPAPVDLTVKHDLENRAAKLNGALLPTGSIRLTDSPAIPSLPGFAEGEWWVQDTAASLPARLFDDIKGKRVADLCAAPGGKTAQLAAAGAEVTAIDRSASRLALLKENLERLQLTAEIIEADILKWQPDSPFDAILLDAPCSATGTIRRHPEILRNKTPKDVAGLSGIQEKMLAHAANLLKPGGTLVYCTCSLQPEEGEAQIARFLQSTPSFQLSPIDSSQVSGSAEFITREGFLRTLPSHYAESGGMDGFFAARLVKTGL